jgi:adenylate kinase
MGILGSIDPFSTLGGSANSKLLMLGQPDARWDRARSLQIEHVSPASLMTREISRRPSSGQAARSFSETELIARLRRWFFGRKPDAGFLLAEFPATLLQARILDEWLETRNEGLDAVVAGSNAPASVLAHYRGLGLAILP